MSTTDRWHQYLFESHSEATLRSWAKRLQKFRFCRAYGGHVGGGDTLKVCYVYNDVSDIQSFFTAVGVPLVVHAKRPAEPEVGVSYRGDVFASFPHLIAGTSWVEQPRQCLIAGQTVFAWCEGNRITLSISTGYEVTESNVEEAGIVERALEEVPLSLLDPPVNSRNCVCPKFYPEYFA
ncbi:hypothetical protein [Methyloversatilis sp.]|uniref:hypothetical protein n=1 Tax=Methyloversatilis sp. TaxID=2569862 RepID=UPI0027B9A465|nr:hypothetical protein [Methyloversatilis sp.]